MQTKTFYVTVFFSSCSPTVCGRMSLTEVVFPALAEWVPTMSTAVLLDASLQPQQLYTVALR